MEYQKYQSKKRIYIFFGEMGAGKNYYGERYCEDNCREFLDGDNLATSAMIERVSHFRPLTKTIINNYIWANLIPEIVRRGDNDLVVAQALYSDKDRIAIRDYLIKKDFVVHFIWVKPSFIRNMKQLWSRPNGFKWILYWLFNKPFFQKPTHAYKII